MVFHTLFAVRREKQCAASSQPVRKGMTQSDRKGHRLRHKEGFGVRLLLASMIVAVLSVAAPATSFAQKDVDPARLAAAKELLVVAGFRQAVRSRGAADYAAA